MDLKRAPQPQPLSINSLILHRERYDIDPTYQRAEGIWSRKAEQYLIDTVIRGYAMPAVFIHSSDDVDYIVDGQQRIMTILKFYDEELPLSEKYSKDIMYDEQNPGSDDGSPARFYGDLSREYQDRFDRYEIPSIELDDYNDEEIRDLFRRLQSGVQLTPGEKINALPGNIVETMRHLAGLNFFSKTVSMDKRRYKHYYLAAQMMYLESEGINNLSPNNIYWFFEENKNLTYRSTIYSRVKHNLDYLYEVFPEETWELRKPSWIITLYLLTSYLRDNYAMKNQKRHLHDFIMEFHHLFIDPSEIKSRELNNYYMANRASTNSQENIEKRHKIIKKRFLKACNPKRLDENRLFTDKQKLKIYDRDDGRCQKCSTALKYRNKNTQYHHKDRYIDGGQTEVENGMLVCARCHLKIHGESK